MEKLQGRGGWRAGRGCRVEEAGGQGDATRLEEAGGQCWGGGQEEAAGWRRRRRLKGRERLLVWRRLEARERLPGWRNLENDLPASRAREDQ